MQIALSVLAKRIATCWSWNLLLFSAFFLIEKIEVHFIKRLERCAHTTLSSGIPSNVPSFNIICITHVFQLYVLVFAIPLSSSTCVSCLVYGIIRFFVENEIEFSRQFTSITSIKLQIISILGPIVAVIDQNVFKLADSNVKMEKQNHN